MFPTFVCFIDLFLNAFYFFFFLNLNFIFLSQALVNHATNQKHQVKVLKFCHVFYICWLLGVMVIWLFMKTAHWQNITQPI